MKRGFEISSVESPAPGARVGHYDQLDEGAKARFPDLLPEDDGEAVVVNEDRDVFGAYDVVKFTSFYRISSNARLSTCD